MPFLFLTSAHTVHTSIIMFHSHFCSVMLLLTLALNSCSEILSTIFGSLQHFNVCVSVYSPKIKDELTLKNPELKFRTIMQQKKN